MNSTLAECGPSIQAKLVTRKGRFLIMLKNCSRHDRRGLRIMFAKPLTAVGLLLMAAIMTNAYTLVLRDGRRMEIPDEFTLTRSTLTYEISPGFNKTMLVTLIDVPATERANKE